MTDQQINPRFGIYRTPCEDSYGDPYFNDISRTGMILYPKDNHTKQALPPMVLSFVNGSMAINPLNAEVNAANFDHYVMDVIHSGNYRFARFDARRNKSEPAVAYFDPAKGYYGTVDPDAEEPANEGDNY